MPKDEKVNLGTIGRQQRTVAIEVATLQNDRDAAERSTAEQAARNEQTAKCHEIIGRIQAVKMMADFANIGGLLWVQQVKETKIYKDLPNVGTWENFCKYIGSSRQKIEEDLKNLAVFGEAFTTTVGAFGVGYHDLRKLRQLAQDGFIQTEDGAITIEGKIIPIDADHTDELHTAIERILEANAKLTVRVGKLEKNKDAIVREETKALMMEKELAVKEVQRLKVYDPETKDRSWSVNQMTELNKDGNSYCNTIAKFILDPRMKEDRKLTAQIDSLITEAEMTLKDLRDRFDAEHNLYGD